MRIVLDLPENCKDDTETSYTHSQFPLLLASYIIIEHLSQATLIHYSLEKSPYFIQVLFRRHITFIHHISSGRTWLWQFPMLSVFDDIGSVRSELRIL